MGGFRMPNKATAEKTAPGVNLSGDAVAANVRNDAIAARIGEATIVHSISV